VRLTNLTQFNRTHRFVGGLGLVLGLVLGVAEVRAEETVRLQGDASLVREVAGLLEARGIRMGEAGLVVDVREADAQIHLRAELAGGKVVERSMNTPDAAATWVESLVRRDLSDPLLAPRQPPRVPTVPPPVPAVVSVVPAANETAHAFRFYLDLAWVTTFGSDLSLATGAGASGCYHLGRACVGVRARYLDQVLGSRDDRGSAASGASLSIKRSYADFQALVLMPVAVSRWVLAPGAGVGMRRLTAQAEVDDEETDHTGWGACASLSIQAIRVFRYGLAVTAGAEVQAGFGRPSESFSLEKTHFPGLPRFAMLGSLGVAFYP
jgi:hypothetical protein